MVDEGGKEKGLGRVPSAPHEGQGKGIREIGGRGERGVGGGLGRREEWRDEGERGRVGCVCVGGR